MGSSQPQTPSPIQATQVPAGSGTPAARWAALDGLLDRLRSTLRWKPVAILALITLLGFGAYAGFVRLMKGPAEVDIRFQQVQRRSFPVVLEEKGELKAANSIDIRCELEGRSTIIYLIDEGTAVKKGDLLVELASDQIDEQIRDVEIKAATAEAAYQAAVKEHEILKDENTSKISKARLALRLAEQALEKYEKGEKLVAEQDAKLALEKSRSVSTRSSEDYQDSRDLFQQGFITKIELENDRFAEYAAGIEVEKAKLAKEVLDAYTVPMSTEEKKSNVEEAGKELDRERKAAQASEAKSEAGVKARESELSLVRDKLAKLQDQKKKAKITAPADGLVVYARADDWWRSETHIQVGVQVYERQPIIELPDTRTMKVVVRVHEARTEHLKVGLPAVVEIEGFTGRQFTGKVSKIAVLADSKNRYLNPNLKEYETEIQLDGEFTELKPGTTAHGKITMADVVNAPAVPVQAVFAKGGKYYVFVSDADAIHPVEVKVGLASNEYVEIKQGLTEGQKVCLAVSEEMKLMLPDEVGTGARSEKPKAPRDKGQGGIEPRKADGPKPPGTPGSAGLRPTDRPPTTAPTGMRQRRDGGRG